MALACELVPPGSTCPYSAGLTPSFSCEWTLPTTPQLPTLLHSCQEVEGFAWLVSWLRNLAPLCRPVLATLFTSSTSHDTSLSASPLFETQVGRGALTVGLLKPSSTTLSSAATQSHLLCPYTHLSHYLIWKPQFRGNGNPWSGGRDWTKSVIPSVFSLGHNVFLPLTYSSQNIFLKLLKTNSVISDY